MLKQNHTGIFIWRWNTITGYWNMVRHCEMGTAEEWLDVFRKDEPDKVYKLAVTRPRVAPKS